MRRTYVEVNRCLTYTVMAASSLKFAMHWHVSNKYGACSTQYVNILVSLCI